MQLMGPISPALNFARLIYQLESDLLLPSTLFADVRFNFPRRDTFISPHAYLLARLFLSLTSPAIIYNSIYVRPMRVQGASGYQLVSATYLFFFFRNASRSL